MARPTQSGFQRTLRRPIEERSPLALGIAAVALIVLTLAVLLGISRFGAGTVRYEGEFAQAAGISPGDMVSVAGVQVGSVAATRLEGDRVVVAFDVDGNVAVGPQSQASIKLTTLLGTRYVELRPAGAGELPDRLIPLSNTAVPYDLQQVLADSTTTFEEVDAAGIGDAMTTLATQLEGTPELVPQVLANMESLSAILADRRAQIGTLLQSTQTLTDAVHSQQGQLGALIRDGNALVEEVALRQNTLERLLSSTTTLVDRLSTTLVEHRPEVDALLASLQNLLGTLSANDALLRNTLEVLPVGIRNFTNASGTANEIDFTAPSGPLIDSWMCAISGHAELRGLPPYFQDCR
ncbi:MCE family protein [Rhodococcus gannanensis]|uniref:MCE family protein n=1 Tax=Rhodococcus gannanensis TaxID=1960308 RepID=A0ABW4P9B9_9NOCA